MVRKGSSTGVNVVLISGTAFLAEPGGQPCHSSDHKENGRFPVTSRCCITSALYRKRKLKGAQLAGHFGRN